MINASPAGSSCTLQLSWSTLQTFRVPSRPLPTIKWTLHKSSLRVVSQQTRYRFEALEVRPISFSFNVGTLKSCWRKPKGRFPECLSYTPRLFQRILTSLSLSETQWVQRISTKSIWMKHDCSSQFLAFQNCDTGQYVRNRYCYLYILCH